MTEGPFIRELDITLDRSSSVPLYHQLATSIERAISSGELAAGDRLENEISLTRRLGLSRPTARQAIQELVTKGMLVRKRGVGTQVVNAQFRRDERLTSLHDDLEKAGKKPGTRLLSYAIGDVDDDVRAAIRSTENTDTEFLKITRLRFSDGVPLAVLTNYLPARYVISEADLSERSLYACLRSLGVNLKIAHQRIGARMMTAGEAALLDEDGPSACLTADRLAYDDTGQFVELGHHLYRATHYTIQSVLVV